MSKIYEIVIDRDQDIKESIKNFLVEHGWEKAYISGAIGSVKNVKITTPINMDLPPQIETYTFQGPAEILSFTGEIMSKEKMDPDLKGVYPAEDDSLFIHIHASIALAGAKVYGGGFHQGKAFRKVKVYIQEQE